MSEQTSSPNRGRWAKRAARVAGTLAGAAIAGGAIVGCNAGAEPAPTVGIMKTVEAEPEVEVASKLEARVNEVSIGIALDLLGTLEHTGGTGYRGDGYGNKNFKKPGAPEGFIVVDELNGKLHVSVGNAYIRKTGKPVTTYGDTFPKNGIEFTSISMTFDIGPDSSITDIPRQLTRTDFSRILGEGELSLQRATGTWYDAGSPNVPGVMAFAITSDGLGGYYVATKEDATGLGGDLGDQHPGTSEEVRLALRIAGAAAEDLGYDAVRYPSDL